MKKDDQLHYTEDSSHSLTADISGEPPVILVVDDEEELVKLLTFNLEQDNYRVIAAYTGGQALEEAFSSVPDLIILDVMLPEMDGLEVCRRLRSYPRTAAIPILMLSARREELDRVLGLEMGADDYVVKPFSVREILARVKAMIRRSRRSAASAQGKGELMAEEEKSNVLQAGDIILNQEQYQVSVRGVDCPLTHKEFELLRMMMENKGKVLTRDILLDKVWGYETEVDTRTVDVHIRYLRQKIEEDPANPVYIKTVRGVGYRFTY